jgi:hypothetical protein
LYSKLNIMIKKENVLQVLNLQKSEIFESFPSIFSREDVISILEGIEDQIMTMETKGTKTETETETSNVDVKELVKRIKESVKETIENFDFDECVSLELSYSNQIEINVDYEEIVRHCDNEINESVENYLEEIEEETQEVEN